MQSHSVVIVFSAALLSYVMAGFQTAEIVEMVDLETMLERLSVTSIWVSKHRVFYLDIAAACDFYLNSLEVLDLIPCF